jgi:hypothetical protein
MAEHAGLSEAAQKAAMEFAMDAVKRLPKGDPEALEAHITGVLIVFWGALWGSFGTEYARGFIEAQLRGMGPDQSHEVFTPPRLQ